MKRVVEILMRRDGMIKEEAISLVKETIEELQEEIFNGGTHKDAQDIVESNLGLEPDYLEDLLF